MLIDLESVDTSGCDLNSSLSESASNWPQCHLVQSNIELMQMINVQVILKRKSTSHGIIYTIVSYRCVIYTFMFVGSN